VEDVVQVTLYKTRIGHVYKLTRGRIGHIYPLRREYGSEGKTEG